MKHLNTILLILLMAAALLLSACGIQAALSSADAKTDSAALTATVTATDTASGTSAAVQTGADSSSDLFSDRDLSGDYDADEAVTITLNGASASASSDVVTIDGGTVTITSAGTYLLSGTLEDGSIIIDATKDDKIQLVLDGVTIHSETFAAIYVLQADKVFVTLAEGSVNTLSNGGGFQYIDDNKVDGVIFAKDDITLNGSGSLTITSPDANGIVGKDEVTITGGSYTITAAKHAIEANDSIAVSDGSFTLNAGEDGLHAENDDDDSLGNIYITGGSFVINVGDDAIHANTLLQIDGGSMAITAAEGLEATYIVINDGNIYISASDDGVNAARKSSYYSTPVFEMNGGTLTIVMGAGDTDGIDSNGNIVINGGTIDVTGQSTFDYDGTAEYNGGTIIVNGQQVDSIPNQMMGGGMGGNGGMGGHGNGGGRRP